MQLPLAMQPAPRIRRRDEDFLRWQRRCREADTIEAQIAERWPDEEIVSPAERDEYYHLCDVSYRITQDAIALFAPLVPRVKGWWG